MWVGAGKGEGGCMCTSWVHGTFKTTTFSEITKKDKTSTTLPCSVDFCVSNPPLTEDKTYIFLHCLYIASRAFCSSEMLNNQPCVFTPSSEAWVWPASQFHLMLQQSVHVGTTPSFNLNHPFCPVVTTAMADTCLEVAEPSTSRASLHCRKNHAWV